MLPEIHLDTDSFEEIVKKARSQISEISPDWTDYNAHDPGITLLELLAFLKEAQQYYIDQIDDTIRKKFLRLLGISLTKRQPARAVAILKTSFPLSIFPGTKFWNGPICFETIQEEFIPTDCMKAWISRTKNGTVYQKSAEEMKKEHKGTFYPFGQGAQEGESFFLCLDEKLFVGNTVHLVLELQDSYKIKRNPLRHIEKFVPLSDISLSFYGKNGYQTLEMIDNTAGFLQSGVISFTLPEEMEETSEEGQRGYFLRFTIAHDAFDVRPEIKSITFQEILLEQKETKAVFLEKESAERWFQGETDIDYYRLEEGYYIKCPKKEADMAAVYEKDFYSQKILAIGDGFPNQCYILPKEGVLSNTVEIFTESIEHKNYYRYWKQVPDFDTSSPEDCHYVVEEETGKIYFGNGVKGRMPETEIRIISCAFSQEEKGNLKSGKILSCETEEGEIFVEIRKDAQGGEKPEPIDHGFSRARDIFKEEGRLVTTADFERAVFETPGLRIRNCKVLDTALFPDAKYQNEVRIVVQPYTLEKRAVLSQEYQKNIYNHLEGKRLIGTSVKLYSPEYIEMDIYVEVLVKPQYMNGREQVERAVRNFFEEVEDFGAVIRYGALFACIDALKEVAEVRTVSLNILNNRIVREKNGDVKLPVMGVLLIQKLDCVIVH